MRTTGGGGRRIGGGGRGEGRGGGGRGGGEGASPAAVSSGLHAASAHPVLPLQSLSCPALQEASVSLAGLALRHTATLAPPLVALTKRTTSPERV